MKPAALLVILLIAVFSIGSFFLFLEFDPNKLRPEIEKALERELAVRAKVGYVTLHWGFGLGFELHGIILRDPAAKTTLLKADKTVIMLDGSSLIGRRLIFKSVVIHHPEINLVGSKDGRWNYPGRRLLHLPDRKSHNIKRGGEKTRVQSDQREPAPSTLKILEGTLHLRNESGKWLRQLTLSNFSMEIVQPRSAAPVQFRLSTTAPSGFSLPVPVSLEALYNPLDDQMEFYLVCGPKIAEIDGLITAWSSRQPILKASLEIHQYDLGREVPEQTLLNHTVSGIVTAQIEGQGSNLDLDTFMENIALSGSIDIRDGALNKANIVRGVLEKLSPIPGFSNLIFMQAPQELKALFESPSTPFSIFQSNFKFNNGILTVENAVLQHRDYLIAATGKYTAADRHINLVCQLICLDPMSRFLTDKLRELEAMQNRQRRVVIPFFYQGLYPEGVKIAIN